MKIWVVYSDFGLNGAEVHGVYTEEPDNKEVDTWAHTDRRDDTGFQWRPSGVTGYGGTFIKEFEVDAPLR